MNALKLSTGILLMALATTLPMAGKERKERHTKACEDTVVVTPPSDEVSIEASASGSPYGISSHEKRIIKDYIQRTAVTTPRGKIAHKLPPGFTKKADLPPGWEKKCLKGEILPEPAFAQAEPLPREVTAKLPTGPKGTILLAMEGKIMRLMFATHEILDVFDMTR